MTRCNSVFQEMIKIEIKIELTRKKSSSEAKTLVHAALSRCFRHICENSSFLNFIVRLFSGSHTQNHEYQRRSCTLYGSLTA